MKEALLPLAFGFLWPLSLLAAFLMGWDYGERKYTVKKIIERIKARGPIKCSCGPNEACSFCQKN